MKCSDHSRLAALPSVVHPATAAVTSLRDHAPSQYFPAGLSQNRRIQRSIVWAAARDSGVNETVEVPRAVPSTLSPEMRANFVGIGQ